MMRFVAGGIAALLLVAAGIFAWTGLGRGDAVSLPRAPAAALADTRDGGDVDAPPVASSETREQRRFGRYDRDRDGKVDREEYLASRRKAFARLDLDHNGTLSFDEYAAKSAGRFAAADGDKSGALMPSEFAATRIERRYRPKCPPPARNPAGDVSDDG